MNDHKGYNADGKVLYTLVLFDTDNNYSNCLCGHIYYIGCKPDKVWHEFLDHIKKFGTVIEDSTT